MTIILVEKSLTSFEETGGDFRLSRVEEKQATRSCGETDLMKGTVPRHPSKAETEQQEASFPWMMATA